MKKVNTKNIKVGLIIGIFLLSSILRLFTIFTMTQEEPVPKKDALDYDKLGWNIATHGIYSIDGSAINTTRPPAYPIFLAGIYKIFGHSYFAVRIIQALISALTCVIIYLIGKCVFNNFVGVIAGLISSVYPPFIYYMYYGGPSFIIPETLFLFLFSIATLFILKSYEGRHISYLILSAIFMALSILTKPIVLLLPIFIAFWGIYILKPDYGKAIKKFAIYLCFFLLTLLPWTLRNYMVSGKFILISSSGGAEIWSGNNSGARGGILARVESIPEYNPSEFAGLSQIERNNAYLRKAIEYILTHPSRIPYLSFRKILVQWNVFNEDNHYNLAYGVVLSFALWVLINAIRFNNKGGILLILFLLNSTFMAVLSAGDPRFRYLYEPCIIILAAAGFYNIVGLRLPAFKRASIISFVLLLNCLGFIFSNKIYSAISNIF